MYILLYAPYIRTYVHICRTYGHCAKCCCFIRGTLNPSQSQWMRHQETKPTSPEDVEPPEDVETPESPEKPEQVKPPSPEMSLPAGLTASDIVDIPADQKPAKMGEVCKYMTWAWCNRGKVRGRNAGPSYRKDGHPLCCFKGSLPVETPEETDAKLQFSTGFLCA